MNRQIGEIRAKYGLSHTESPAAAKVPAIVIPAHVTPPSVDRNMTFWRVVRPPLNSFIAATNAVPSGPPVSWTSRRNPVVSGVGADQIVPSSEWVTKIRPPELKSFQEMYMRPKNGLSGVLSTHIDSRSSPLPMWAHAPAVQVRPSGD